MKRALILALPLVLAVAACGDDDDDDSPDVTDSAATSVATEDTSTDDSLLPGGTIVPGGTVLPGGTALPGGTVPDLSIRENAEEFMRDALSDLGLDDEQVDCLIEELNIESGEVPDVNEMMDLFDDCDIDLADLQSGG